MVNLCIFYNYFIFLRGKVKAFSDVPSSDGRIHHQQTNIEGIFVKKKMTPHGNQGLPRRMKSTRNVNI